MKRIVFYPMLAVGGYIIFLLILFFVQDRVIFVVQPDPVNLPPDAPMFEHIIETSDGEALVAWYAPAEELCPTVLMLHGNAERLWPHDPQFALLQKHGIGFLALAFRGYSGSTGHPSEDGLYIDAHAAYNYLRQLGVPETDIVVRGFSLGSAPAAHLASEQPIGALILGAPFYSAVQMGRDRLPFVPVDLILRHDFRTDKRIADVGVPILIGHGEADQVIPASHSERLQALAPDNIERITFPGVDHNSLYYSGIYRDAIWPFLGPLYPDCPSLQTTDEVTL